MGCSLSGECIEPHQLREPDTGYAWINEYFNRFISVGARMAVNTEMIRDISENIHHWVLSIKLDFKVSHNTIAVEDYPVFVKSIEDLDLNRIKFELVVALSSAYTSLKAVRIRELKEIEDCRKRSHCDPEALKDTGGHIIRVEGKNFKFK